jgi:cysteine desulfurase/selenocysteine lyase
MLDLSTIRAQFPILARRVYGRRLVYLDNAATTQKPQSVLNRILEYYTAFNSNIHRGVHFLSEQASGLYEMGRTTVQQFIHAASDSEIIFTHGTTDAINLLAGSFGDAFVAEGDEIIVTEMEHHSNLVPWQNLCLRQGARLKILSFNDDGGLALDQLQALISPKTKLLSLTYVSNVLGQINPVGEIIGLAHARGVPVLIDGAQAIAHLPVDVQDLDCDFFAFSGHKMYAETGIGVLYGKHRWLEKMPPYQSGGGMIGSVDQEVSTYAEAPHKFEAGTPHIAGVVGLAAAIGYIQEIGRARIADHEADLLRYAADQLAKVDGITLYGRSTLRCGAVSFNLADLHPYDVGAILDKMGIAVRTGAMCAQPVMRHYGIEGTLRASVAVYNTRAEIDQLIVGLNKARQLLETY